MDENLIKFQILEQNTEREVNIDGELNFKKLYLFLYHRR